MNPIFEISPLEPRFSEWLVFEGISVDENGKQHYLVMPPLRFASNVYLRLLADWQFFFVHGLLPLHPPF